MRINPITTNYRPYSAISKPKSNQQPQTSGLNSPVSSMAAGYYPVNFRGVPMPINDIVKQIPLEDRLASMFEHFKLGDLILVGKKLGESAKKMYESSGAVKNAIKRGFFY